MSGKPHRTMKLLRACLLLLAWPAAPAAGQAPPLPPFTWANPVVYAVTLDRPVNGAPRNDPSYAAEAARHDHGGDLASLTARVDSGYFDSLGVNVLCVPAPFAQVRGRDTGADSGWGFDYTAVDSSLGTTEALRRLVDAAHARGLRVLLDLVLVYPGPADPAPTQAGAADTLSLLPLLASRWSQEKRDLERASLDAFFARTGYTRTPANHTVKWLADWVRQYGIDGFRIEGAGRVDPALLQRLKQEATIALAAWHDEQDLSRREGPGFWMAGVLYGDVTERTLAERGLDAVFRPLPLPELARSAAEPDSLFTHHAARISALGATGLLTYVSPVDADHPGLLQAGILLMLLPGGVQLPDGPVIAEAAGQEGLRHWRALSRFRHRHPALAVGRHARLSEAPYTFRRTYHRGSLRDDVIVVLGASGRTTVNVSRVFPDNALLRDAYTGATVLVSYGMVTLEASPGGVLLLEEIP